MIRFYLDDLEDFVSRFVWTQDGIDTYRILSAPKGKLRGDCDDFAVTVLWMVDGRSMWRFWWSLITFRAILWRVKGEGFASHMVLYHRKWGYIDNQNPEFGENRHTRRYPVPLPIVAIKMLMGRIK